ncbi:family 43 glycosylhydrolase [Niallia sp.]|uniref:family 43 glycosylhydrolase n=1 Tax=Niallia sp. TaxID=2837523 RepID=UPI00289940E3|nr:family 43 glycosylhydrolase [Niallia sp.]
MSKERQLQGMKISGKVATIFDGYNVRLYINRGRLHGDRNAIPITWLVSPETLIVDGQQEVYDVTKPINLTTSNNGKKEIWNITPILSNNPVLAEEYADPDIIRYGDMYYLYPTTDGFVGWSGYQLSVFSSKDLVNWTNEGIILDLKSEVEYQNQCGRKVGIVPWATGNAWAPAITEKNGKFYYYFCGHDKNTQKKAIGVAVSDSPIGPFKAKEKPLLTMEDCQSSGIEMGQTIDPAVYQENDKSYLLFGNGHAAIVELKQNMVEIIPETVKNIEGAEDFREAICVNKIDNVYHFTWSSDDTGSENYSVNYGISHSLFGPIDFKYKLLEKRSDLTILGTGHHSILYIEEEDKYLIAYHRFLTPLGQIQSGFGYHREVCFDWLEYKDGLFKKVTPTHKGIRIKWEGEQ